MKTEGEKILAFPIRRAINYGQFANIIGHTGVKECLNAASWLPQLLACFLPQCMAALCPAPPWGDNHSQHDVSEWHPWAQPLIYSSDI